VIKWAHLVKYRNRDTAFKQQYNRREAAMWDITKDQ
jgi:hypothetical protein